MSASSLRWRELVPGLAVSATLALVAWAVLRYAQVGSMRGDTIELHAPVASARGIMRGSQVWLAGHAIGKVRDVEFLPITTDTASRVVVRMQVLAEHREQIRRDSYAQIRSGANLIGSPVVYIMPGSPASPALGDGDTLLTRAQLDPESFSSQLAVASRSFPEIIANVKVLGAQLETTEGTLGALLGDNSGRLEVVATRAGQVAQKIGGDASAMRRAIGPGGLTDRVGVVRARADSMRALLAGDAGALGRFRRDSTLATQVRELRDEVSIVRALLAEPRGTAGRALHDRAAYDELSRLERDLGLLMDDIKRRPLRYVVF